jgi:CubicO group peptidase (beta-lactamase class C family)
VRSVHRSSAFAALLFLAAFATQSGAQNAKLDAYFTEKDGLISGSFAVAERGVVRYRRAVGFAILQNGVPQATDPGTRYRIGPVSQLFTAALVLQFAERGTITLDNRLAEFFPDEPGAIDITYREMLRSRGGSSGYNYLLLGRMLEKVADRPLADILVQHIAGKFGLARTHMAGFGMARTFEAASYHWTTEGWRSDPAADQTGGGASGIVSNASDLVVFMDALFAGKVVTPHSLASMRGDDGGPGIAMQPATIAGIAAFCARGAIESFESAVCHFPERRISIAWTGNASRVPLDQILEEAVRLVVRRAK